MWIANSAGPHHRDYARLLRLAEALGLSADWHRANTGTVYVSVWRDDAERVYRFASHPECYDSHDFSVMSPFVSDELPPGYDGSPSDAIRDLVAWAQAQDHPAARRALAAVRAAETRAERRRAEIERRRAEQERAWLEYLRQEEQAAAERRREKRRRRRAYLLARRTR